jgi:ComF family protein
MFWQPFIRTVPQYLTTGLFFLLGSRCLLCSDLTHSRFNFCKSCYQQLPKLPQSCAICAQFLLSSTHLDVICGACQVTPPAYRKIVAAFPYEFPIIQLVIQLKFFRDLTVARGFADCLIQRIKNDAYKNQPLPHCLIPIPLHQDRLRERGFNQSEVIAKHISRQLHIPLDTTTAIRVKHTAPQTQLNAKERRQNMKDAFLIKKSYHGERLAVLDDVVTTGETMRAFCSALKEQGAANIDVWCVARRG